jgi:formate dehydrogenase major subunit
MGKGAGFRFTSAEEIWNEIRAVWPKGAGISYPRLETEGGLQWPCLDERDPGQAILHQQSFAHGTRAGLRRIEFRPPPEAADEAYPFLLMTGRSLYQFNSGTMTMRTHNETLRLADTLDIAGPDAARLGLREGQDVQVISHHGEVTLPAHIDARLSPGRLFATFHSTRAWVNAVTGPARDAYTGTPDYKVTAVRLAALGGV